MTYEDAPYEEAWIGPRASADFFRSCGFLIDREGMEDWEKMPDLEPDQCLIRSPHTRRWDEDMKLVSSTEDEKHERHS